MFEKVKELMIESGWEEAIDFEDFQDMVHWYGDDLDSFMEMWIEPLMK